MTAVAADPRLRDGSRSGPTDDLAADVAAMFGRNPFSLPLAIETVEVSPGSALLVMSTGDAHLNGHGTCHGGALWTLADMAFGAAALHRGYIVTVGSDLSFFRPAPPGSTVWARAREVTRRGATGTYHITLSVDPVDPDGVLAAGSFTGRWPGGG